MFRALAIRSRRPQLSARIDCNNCRWLQKSCLLQQKKTRVNSPAVISDLQSPNPDLQSAATKQDIQISDNNKSSLKARSEDVNSTKSRKKRPSKNANEIHTGAANAASSTVTKEGSEVERKVAKPRSAATKVEGLSTSPKNQKGRKARPKEDAPFIGPKNRRGRRPQTIEEQPAQQVLNPAILVPQKKEKYIRELLRNIGGKSGAMAMDRRRVNIVSEGLCDDILERLGSSLQRHKGCDIIDINPGAGVWSTKLHDYLQPRSHILMESCYETYKTLLDPLLQAPNSKYKLVPKSGVVWNHLERILSKEYLPLQEELDTGDPRLELPNDTLLVVANLASFPKQPYRRFSSIATLISHQFLAASRTHSLFHRYGKIRMLLWLDDDDLSLVVPRALATRKRAAIDAEISCGHVETIVSSASTNTQRYHREASLEFESLRRVLKNMEKKGIKIPKGRESHLMRDMESQKSEINDYSSFVPLYLDELADLKRRYAAGEFKKNSNEVAVPGKNNNTPEYERMRLLQVRLNSDYKKRGRKAELLDQFDAIMALQQKHFTSKNREEKDTLYLELQERTKEWKIAVGNCGEEVQLSVTYLCDQRHAFRQNPPVLLWDRRESEPLRANIENVKSRGEFYPTAADLALVDFQPCALPLSITSNLAENYDVLDYILQKFFSSPSQTLNETLKSLWPGGYEWLMADCRDLKDPTKGGSYDLDLIRARALPASLLMSIVESWLRWPYRPSRLQVIKSIGTEVYDSAEEE